MENMCHLTEYKYKGSHEHIDIAIMQYAIYLIMDIINYFEQLVFSFLTGNTDMHQEHLSLFKEPKIGYVLWPMIWLLTAGWYKMMKQNYTVLILESANRLFL